MMIKAYSHIIFLICFSMIYSLVSHSQVDQQADKNKPPIASFYMEPEDPFGGAPILLVSSSKDPEGDFLRYEWTMDGQVIGTTDSLATYVTDAENDEVKFLEIILTVTDDKGATSTAQKRFQLSSFEEEEELTGLSYSALFIFWGVVILLGIIGLIFIVRKLKKN